MGLLGNVLSLPVSGPLGAVGWLARQVAEAAVTELLDPVRIERALLALARRLEAGEIDEAAFEAEESRLLDELVEMRACRSGLEAGDAAAGDTGEVPEDPAADPQPTVEQSEAEPWTAA